jgi:hypothetical protein
MARARCARIGPSALSSLLALLLSGAAVASAVPADRIVLAYEEGRFRIVSRTAVAKTVEPSDDAGDPAPEFWIETRAADGAVRHRRAMPDPRSPIHESFAAESIERADAPGDAAIFAVVVPAAEPGDVLFLFGRPSPPEAVTLLARLAIPEPAAAIAPLAAGDGSVVGVTKIVDRGPEASRFNLVVVAEGFQQHELPAFAARTEEFLAFFLGFPPFSDLADGINVFRVDIASAESGADSPLECGGTGVYVATYLDAVACPSTRLLTLDFARAQALLGQLVPEYDQAIVIVNTTVWAGAGGAIAVTSLEPTWWTRIATHEVGHGFDLADEYDYCCCEQHTGGEPSEPNVTSDTNRALGKWSDLVAPETPFPTTSCASWCPSGQPPAYAGEEVGLHEGARYLQCGIHRPTAGCMMRSIDASLCPVCARRIREVLGPFSAQGVPAAPRNLTAAAVPGEPEVHLAWGAVNGADHYEVLRADSPSDPLALVAASATPNFIDRGVSFGASYLYRVRSVGAAGLAGPPSGHRAVSVPEPGAALSGLAAITAFALARRARARVRVCSS